MKRWIIIIGIAVVVLFIIGYLHDQGYLNVEWQGLAMIFAILAGPYKIIKNLFTSEGSVNADQILQKNVDIQKEETQKRIEFENKMKESETKIDTLNKEIDLIKTKYELLEEKKKKIQEDLKKMSDDEVQKKSQEYFGHG